MFPGAEDYVGLLLLVPAFFQLNLKKKGKKQQQGNVKIYR